MAVDEAPTSHAGAGRTLNGSRVVLIGAVAVALVAGYFAAGMPGMDHSPQTARTASTDGSVVALSVEEFARRMEDPAAFAVNVHVPDEGTILGTDVAIPYDRIVGDDRLPGDKAAPILLFCKTGRMSAEATADLTSDGYTNVAHLAGGMDAWSAAGRPLQR